MSKEDSLQERVFLMSYMFRRILVPYDGSANSEKGLRVALELSAILGSKITVAYACEKDKCSEGLLKRAREIAEARGIRIETKLIAYNPEESSESSEIVKEVNSNSYDLVVVGIRGKTEYEGVLKGSVASSLFVNANVSFLFVK
ncbi:MAG: universal stress protein [Fervidicoccaceae archaeon]|jgi:nucleotide-binding universal stress UspA family protein|nr:MAG: universal stress protein [Fervidicoccus sp.]